MRKRPVKYAKARPPDVIVCIDWIDACMQSSEVSRSDLGGPLPLSSVGWLIAEDDISLSLCMDYSPEDDEFRDVMHIVKVNVKKRTEFKVKR